MAIQPIDLQTLFTQLDKVGKTQAAQREGQHIQEVLQQIQSQKKIEENVQAVNEAQETGEGAEKVKDGKGQGASNQGGGKEKAGEKEGEESPADSKAGFIRDPTLGRNIDISG
jgi:hypothetical protein